MGRLIPLVAGALVGLLPLALGLIPGDEASRLERLVVGYGWAGLPFLVVLGTWRRVPSLGALLAVALGIRLLLLLLPPLLSEDIWRYVWDGAVQLAGLDPYTHAPLAPALDHLAADPTLAAVRARIGHGGIPTIYPPGAQITFLFSGLAGPNPLWLRLIFIVADGASVAGLWHWARRLGRPPQLAAVYAFAPPAVLEASVGGHIDALGVALMVGAGLALSGGRWGRAGVALGAGIATKLLPLMVLPVLLRRKVWPVAAVAIGTLVALSLPYRGGPGPGEALAQYGGRWRGNDGAFALLIRALETLWPAGSVLDLPPWAVPWILRLVAAPPDALPWPEAVVFAVSKLIVLGLLALVAGLLWVGLRRAPPADAYRGMLAGMLATLLLLSPVVHPWYLLWLLPFAALDLPNRRWPWPFLLWSGLIFLAYLPRPDYLRTGLWHTAPWTQVVEYLPVWLGLVMVGIRGVQRQRLR